MGGPGGPGRPKKEASFSDIAREILEGNVLSVTLINGDGDVKDIKVTCDNSFHYAIASVLVMESMKGNVKAITELLNRVEGRPIQKVELNTKEPVTQGELMAEMRRLAELEGIPLDDLLLREGIDRIEPI